MMSVIKEGDSAAFSGGEFLIGLRFAKKEKSALFIESYIHTKFPSPTSQKQR